MTSQNINRRGRKTMYERPGTSTIPAKYPVFVSSPPVTPVSRTKLADKGKYENSGYLLCSANEEPIIHVLVLSISLGLGREPKLRV